MFGQWTARAALLAAPVMLWACGGGGSGSDGDGGPGGGPNPSASGCALPLGGGTADVSVSSLNCGGCRVNDTDKAVDANGASFAKLDYDATGGTLVVTAQAQDGIVFPGGDAGLLIGFPQPATQAVFYHSCIRTYLDGLPVETDPSSCLSTNIVTGVGGSTEYRSFTALAPFDAIEFTLSFVQGDDAAQFRIHEFCADTE